MHPRAWKYRLCALAAACVLLAAIPCFGTTNGELCEQIATLERRLADYSQVADAITGQLGSLRKELRDQLQGDFDYLRSLGSGDSAHQQGYAKQLAALRNEIDSRTAKLASQPTASRAATVRKPGQALLPGAENPTRRAVKQGQLAPPTDTFNRNLSSVSGNDALRTLSSMVLFEASRAIDPGSSLQTPQAMLNILTLTNDHAFNLNDFVAAGTMPPHHQVAVAQTLVNLCS